MKIYVGKNQEQLGPFSSDEIQERLITGELAATDLGWHEGMENWTPLKEFLETPPPLPADPASSQRPAPQAEPAEEPEAYFFYIPVSRMLWMGLAAPFFFRVYWMYKNWKYLQRHGNGEIMPFWRAVFAVIWVYPLLLKIQKASRHRNYTRWAFSEHLAAVFIACAVGANILSRFGNMQSLIALAVGCTAFLSLFPVQCHINAANKERVPQANYHPWSTGHIICLVLGLFFWVIMTLGLATILLGLSPQE